MSQRKGKSCITYSIGIVIYKPLVLASLAFHVIEGLTVIIQEIIYHESRIICNEKSTTGSKKKEN